MVEKSGMAEKSPGKEFLEVAIEIERNGFNFYESVARRGLNKEIKDIFTQLAGKEKEHEHTFRDMLTHIGGYVAEHPCANYQYVRSVADSNVFTQEQARTLMAKDITTDIEAAEIGINFEKESILLYSEIRGMVPQADQNIIDMITNEEKKHLSELMYLVNRLKSGARI